MKLTLDTCYRCCAEMRAVGSSYKRGAKHKEKLCSSLLSIAVSTMMALCRGIVSRARQCNQTNLVSSNPGAAPGAESQLLHVGLRSTLAGPEIRFVSPPGR
jgi:hypothetical protein